jgi:hypothetical protein
VVEIGHPALSASTYKPFRFKELETVRYVQFVCDGGLVMKTKVLGLLLLAGTSLFARTHVSIGIGIGGFYPYGYYAPPPVYYAPPPVYYAPAPAYYAPAPVYPAYGSVWISGYYYPYGGRRVWRPGYWGRRPFAGAAWVSPYWVGGRFHAGYWRR